MTTAQTIIEAAYSRSTANDPGKLAGDVELLGHLNRKFQSMYAVMAVLGGDNALTKAAFVLAGSPPAVTLPTETIDIVRIEKTTTSARVNLIPANEKDRGWHLAPAVYRQGPQIVSRAQTGDPIATDSLTIFYLDPPATVSALASVIDGRFPVRYEDILILDLAIYLSVKDEDRDEKDWKALKDEYANAMAAFNLVVQKANTAKDRA